MTLKFHAAIDDVIYFAQLITIQRTSYVYAQYPEILVTRIHPRTCKYVRLPVLHLAHPIY